MPNFPCPCCGHVVFPEPSGSYDICPMCFWEDDPLQLEFATTLAGGANAPTLLEAQRNYSLFGACEQRFVGMVSPPTHETPRETGWRPIDPERDRFPNWPSYGDRAPPGGELLYYWRETFWRRWGRE